MFEFLYNCFIELINYLWFYSDENFDEVQDEEVRAWLATTFTKKESVYAREASSRVPRFKTVAQLLVIGNYVHS